jgi:hypothetical protein
MSALAAFLWELLVDGRVRLQDRPTPCAPAAAGEALAVLRRTYAEYRLDVAGPLIEMDEPVALRAADLVRHSAWFLVSRDQPPEELDERLVMPGPPRSAAQHLSADLLLRFLPMIHRRARALDPADRLAVRLAEILRHWPLSGVLSAVEEAPLTPLDFAGHSGLLLIYAERLARHVKPAWVPDGPGLGYLELVWQELGKNLDALPRPVAPATANGGGD